MAGDLSLGAELLLLSVDPAKGGLFPHRRRRLRRALRGAGGQSGRRARREALRELELAGLIEPHRLGSRLRLADRAQAAQRFNRVRRCLRDDDFADPHDRALVVLLAWTGVLARRLSRDERRVALRRLRVLSRSPMLVAAGGGPGEADALADTLHSDLVCDAAVDFAAGDACGLDATSVGAGAAGEGWAAPDAGSSDAR